jgi:iron complex transport system substrate-binding protein
VRIVSLLPSATEILYAVGAGPDVVGVTFECDEPARARTDARVVSTSSLPTAHGQDVPTPAEIDAAVRARLEAGEDLYHLDRGALADLDADLVVTQDLCAVCAVDVSEVRDALEHLGCSAQVLTTDPDTIGQVLESIVDIGRACGREPAALDLVAGLRRRLEALPGAPGPDARRVAVLEWTDPPFAPGHWVPEMVEVAGGLNVLGSAGARSVATTWDAVAAAAPDVVVVAPCGFDLATSVRLTRELLDGPLAALPGVQQVWAVDANASYARPGPRIVDGTEALAAIVDPGRWGPPDAGLAERCR